jgi:hypothetical protein
MPTPGETTLPEESATVPQLSPEQISDMIEQSIEASIEKNT